MRAASGRWVSVVSAQLLDVLVVAGRQVHRTGDGVVLVAGPPGAFALAGLDESVDDRWALVAQVARSVRRPVTPVLVVEGDAGPVAPTPGPRGVVVRSDHLLRWLLDQPSHEASRVTPTVLGLTGATGGRASSGTPGPRGCAGTWCAAWSWPSSSSCSCSSWWCPRSWSHSTA